MTGVQAFVPVFVCSITKVGLSSFGFYCISDILLH